MVRINSKEVEQRLKKLRKKHHYTKIKGRKKKDSIKMFEYKGIKFDIMERTMENIYNEEPELYQKLRECYVPDDHLWLSYDDVKRLFNPKHCYGRTLEELREKQK